MDAPNNGARLLRGGAVAIVVTAALLAVARLHPSSIAAADGKPSSPLAAADPLVGELRRCKLLGQSAAGDSGCLRAWAENRRRFMAPGARPLAAIEGRR